MVKFSFTGCTKYRGTDNFLIIPLMIKQKHNIVRNCKQIVGGHFGAILVSINRSKPKLKFYCKTDESNPYNLEENG